MNPLYQKLMNDAARLTRSGDLQAATAAIQAALAGATRAAQAAADTASPEGDVIDIKARVVPDTEPDRPRADDRIATFAQPSQPAAGTPSEASNDAPLAHEPRRSDAPSADAGRFIAGHHANRSMGRDYKLYVPPGADGEPLPLVVMLHGCTQHPDDFAAGTGMNELARERGFFVLYPAQSAKANPQRCWNWFKRTHQQRGRGEAALLADMTRHIVSTRRIDPTRVYVAGLSAGGAMAAVLGATYPDVYAAVGVHSGLPAGSAGDLPSALAAMKSGASAAPQPQDAGGALPAIVFHGDADATVHPANGEQVLAALAHAPGATVEVERRPAGATRAVTRRIHRTADGRVVAEHWLVHGAPHAWSGGRRAGSYTDPQGPDATAEMVRFFDGHRLRPR